MCIHCQVVISEHNFISALSLKCYSCSTGGDDDQSKRCGDPDALTSEDEVTVPEGYDRCEYNRYGEDKLSLKTIQGLKKA